jgi:hypothetical protein
MTTTTTTTLTCKCQKVEISIAAPPVNRLECCCRDCRKGLAWCASKGGPPPPPVPDLVYFPNAIRVDMGMKHLKCYLIKQAYNTRRVVAQCCWTCLVADHPSYRGTRIVSYNYTTISNNNNFTRNDDGETLLLPVQRRIFQNDMSPEELALLPLFSPPPVSSAKEVMTKEELDVLLLWSNKNNIAGNTTFDTIQTLIDSLGKIQYMDADYDGPVTSWNKGVSSGSTISYR